LRDFGRPSKSDFDSACRTGSATASSAGCGDGSGSCGAHDRKISKRRYREKVREDIKDYILLMLGAPIVKVELDAQGLDLCVDQSMKIFEDYAPFEYFEYYTFNSTPGKSVYKLPDDVGIVRNVYYNEQGSLNFTAQDLGGSIPIEYFYPGGAYSSIQGGMLDPIQPTWGRMGEWVLYKQYENMYSRVSSHIGGFEFIGDMRTIKLYPTPCRCAKIIVHYMQKCKDWKEAIQALQEGALAHAYIMLGNIRGKYTSPPGPGGGMQLDGPYLRDKGWELKKQWQEELLTRYGECLPITMD
jgi:hypothetical protein